MKKQTLPFFIFAVLLILVVMAFYFGGQKKIFSLPDEPVIPSKNEATSGARPVISSDWPIPLDTQGITGVFAHYYIHGKIVDIQKTTDGGEIKLDAQSDKIPQIIVNPETRFSGISSPYSAATMHPIRFADLAAGQTVDVSIEYDLRSKTWIVRDVYLPKELN